MDRTRSMGVAVGIGRAAVGGMLAVAPRQVGRVWIGNDVERSGTTILVRALGARDVALGMATLAALDSPRDTTTMLRLGFVADLTDAAATLITASALVGPRRIAVPLVTAAVGAAGLAATNWAQHVDAEPTINLAGEIRVKAREREVDLRPADRTRI